MLKKLHGENELEKVSLQPSPLAVLPETLSGCVFYSPYTIILREKLILLFQAANVEEQTLSDDLETELSSAAIPLNIGVGGAGGAKKKQLNINRYDLVR